MLEQLNHTLFLAINGSSQASPALIAVARLLAEGSVPLAALIVAGLWIWGDSQQRGAVLTVAIAVLAGLGIDQAIGFAWYEPRPFVIGIGRTLLTHAPDSSFPSDHATVLWTLGLTLTASRALRGWGWLFVIVGFPVAWARIYLGLHFPLDMAGSIAVSVPTTILARLALPAIERRILPRAEYFYECLRRLTGIAALGRRLRHR